MSNNKYPLTARILDYYINSTAFDYLSAKAKILFIEIYKRAEKRKLANGKWIWINNGQIEFSYNDIKKIRDMYQRGHRIKNVIKELMDTGFIDIACKPKGHKTLYFLDERFQEFNVINRKAKKEPQGNVGKQKKYIRKKTVHHDTKVLYINNGIIPE